MFRGSIVALVTPMTADGVLDYSALERLLSFHISEGTQGVVIAGTTGESPTLSGKELEGLVGRAVEICAGRIPVIGGSGTNSTARTVKLTRRVARAGADAALVVTPYYNKPTQRGLLAHYTAVADGAGLPVIMYNVPGRTGCDLQPETAAALAAHPAIVGLKEATPGTQRLARLRELCPEEFCLLSGDDATGCEFMLAGGWGVISVTANVAPRLMRAVCDAALQGQIEGAREIDGRLSGLHAAMFLEPNPIPVKWAVARLGLIGEGIRLPLTKLEDRFQSAVASAMQAAGLETGVRDKT
ncbi:MAG: 4-hydroxy-tetrahydrodipicolinate synthase [Gammaproteobacteria bacterium]|nr:MAG: 4-hydroxy-tetrahydrodipicolinate synthase [Gammaproteobacteria bacterium]